jgi:hypothetical protein
MQRVIVVRQLIDMENTCVTSKKVFGKDTIKKSFYATLQSGLNNCC